MIALSFYIRQSLLIVISALVTLQGVDVQRFTLIEKEFIEMAEEVYDPVELSLAESKKTNLSKIKRPFYGILYQKIAFSHRGQNAVAKSHLQHQPKLHLLHGVFLI